MSQGYDADDINSWQKEREEKRVGAGQEGIKDISGVFNGCPCEVCARFRRMEQEKRRKELMNEAQNSVGGSPLKGHPMFHQIIQQMRELHAAKNTDYADGMKEGPLGNFTRTSNIQKLYPGMDWSSPFGVAMAYMLKQLDACFVLKSARKESVTGEPVRARLFDVAVYSVLGIILDEEERNRHGLFSSVGGTSQQEMPSALNKVRKT